MKHCIYDTAFGCLRSERCNCDPKIKEENSKVITPYSEQVGEQAMEIPLRKERQR